MNEGKGRMVKFLKKYKGISGRALINTDFTPLIPFSFHP
ncbi:hypothetical protein CHY_2663 [Carboxydothermus hydrogenoformans Z-2901]|uniref:Uncharacterized protein n=1 Tax=Carboxydothermus hydrogenoformans (strain ATCC BAA-161 / DSM 6008 / Z-2901) TaxID=246194 RepID=Q3A8S9_CARHZ|nr:hypothetical protein CHY_2663 [Carboxydothermus hydrogenoformans Z-2901]